MKERDKVFYILIFLLALAVTVSGINVNFFTDDPGLYASIAKNMLYKKQFFELFTYNQDWLDKPHFPFWMVMMSFKIFGVSVWAYKLPALLFFMMGLLYTYLFARRYYGWEIAIIAVLIVMTAQHVLMSNTDVRAEPYLMALVIGSIYHIACLEERYTIAHLLLAALLTACAIMTKGVFVIITIYGSLLGQLLFQKKLSQLFRIKWLLLFVLTFIFTFPEFYALYIQFDMHPEKTVFDRHNVSGIKWFLWDSQFGRFVNNGPIRQNASGNIFFYAHTLLWAFAPWCLLFYYAVYKNVQDIFRRRKLTEYYALSGGLLLLLVFSLSRFQLPFYTNTIFPLFAIITAPYCYARLTNFGTTFRLISQWIYIILFPIVIMVINFYLKPQSYLWFCLDCVVFGFLIFLVSSEVKELHKKTFFFNCLAVLFANFYLNTTVYKEIAGYNGQIKAANYINQNEFDQYHIYSLRYPNDIFQFYSKRPVDFVPLEQFSTFKPALNPVFFVSQKSLDHLTQTHAEFRILKSFENYSDERITPAFINAATRNTVLDHVYLITK